MKESDEYRLGRSAAQRGEPMAKYQGLTARMNPKKRAAFIQGYYDGLRRKEKRLVSRLRGFQSPKDARASLAAATRTRRTRRASMRRSLRLGQRRQ